MKVNNVEIEPALAFVDHVKEHPEAARRRIRVEGEWNPQPDGAQFRAHVRPHDGARVIECELPHELGGTAAAPDAMELWLHAAAAWYASTFVYLATVANVGVRGLRVEAEAEVDLSRTVGLSDRPALGGLSIVLHVDSPATRPELLEIERLTWERCPLVRALTEPIDLQTQLLLEE